MVTDPIADMLTTIRNGQQVKLAQVSVPASKMKEGVLNVLKDEGYIEDFGREEVRKGIANLSIKLRYHQGQPVIKTVKRVSKPGCRIYSSIEDLPKVHNGLGITILSTSKGILPDYKARELKVGGELLCNVF